MQKFVRTQEKFLKSEYITWLLQAYGCFVSFVIILSSQFDHSYLILPCVFNIPHYKSSNTALTLLK